MKDLHIGDRIYRVGHIKRIGTIVSFGTTPRRDGRRKKWIHVVNVEVTTSNGTVQVTWKRRECRLAD